jgi:hypothetical protein
LLRRLLTALGGGLARGLLGRSAHAHMKQFTGSDEYWDRALAAQLAWPGQQPPGTDSVPPGSSRAVVAGTGPMVGATARRPPDPGHAAIRGWTERPLADGIARQLTDKVYLRI